MATRYFRIKASGYTGQYVWVSSSATGTKTYLGVLSTSNLTYTNTSTNYAYIFLSSSSSSYVKSSYTITSATLTSGSGSSVIFKTEDPPYARLYTTSTGYVYFTLGITLSHTITYQTYGGTSVASGSGTVLPSPLPTTTKSGCNFVGWYLDSNFQTLAKAGQDITENTTLYAYWIKGILYEKSYKQNNIRLYKLFSRILLDKPTLTNVLDEGKVTWTAVPNASNYYYIIDGSTRGTVNTTYLQVTNLVGSGSHTIQIKSVGNQSSYFDSDYSTMTGNYLLPKLPTPVLSATPGSTYGSIDWDSITGATDYVVQYSNSQYGTYTTLDSIHQTTFDIDTSNYNGCWFRVKATGSGYRDSDWSNYVEYNYSIIPTEIIHVSMSYSAWGGGDTIGPYDITVYDKHYNLLSCFAYGDNEINFDIDLSDSDYIIIWAPSIYDVDMEATLNVWGGAYGDQYSSSPGDGSVELTYNLSSGDTTLYVHYYSNPY